MHSDGYGDGASVSALAGVQNIFYIIPRRRVQWLISVLMSFVRNLVLCLWFCPGVLFYFIIFLGFRTLK